MTERVLFVHAHPGDETVTTGATIAWLVREGANVTVLTCTRGERSEVIPDGASALTLDPTAIADLRMAELTEAMSILGVTDYRVLGETGARWEGLEPRRYRDSGMTWGSGGPQPALEVPDALVTADEGEVASDIAAAILQVQPDVVVSYGPEGVDGHPDSRRVHDATRWATEVLRVPFYVLGRAHGRGAVDVNDPVSLQTKRAALAAYPSQFSVGEDSFQRASGAPVPLDTPEEFGRLRPPNRGFGGYGRGARVIACGFAALIGLVIGGILTVVHQSSTVVGDTAVPWGLIVALVIAASLLAGLRIVYETRVVASFAAAGLLLAEGLLSVGTPSGTVLVANNFAGVAWTIGSVLIVALVLAWPRFSTVRSGRIEAPAAKG